MSTRVLSLEDKDLGTASLITAVPHQNSDIDLAFKAKPTGDVYKKAEAAAVKQSVKNIISTNYGERPFNYYFGANLRGLLFELGDEAMEFDIEEAIKLAIQNFEPRAEILEVTTNLNDASNTLRVQTRFLIKSIDREEILETTLSRLR